MHYSRSSLDALLLFFLISLYGLGQPTTFNADTLKLNDTEYQIEIEVYSASKGLPHWYIGGVFQAYDGFTYLKNGPYLLRFNGENFMILDTLSNSEKADAFFTDDQKGQIWILSGEQLFIISDQKVYLYSELYKSPLPPNLRRDFALFSHLSFVYLYDPFERALWRFNERWERVLHLGAKKGSCEGKGVNNIFPESDRRWWILCGNEARLYAEGATKLLKKSSVAPYTNEKFTFFQGALSKVKSDGTIRPLIPNVTIRPDLYRASYTLASPYYTDVLNTADYRFEYYTDSTLKLSWRKNFGAKAKQTIFQEPPLFKAYNARPISYSDGHSFAFKTSLPDRLQIVKVNRRRFKTLIQNHSLRYLSLSQNKRIIARLARKSHFHTLDLLNDRTDFFVFDESFSGQKFLPFYYSDQSDSLFLVSGWPSTLYSINNAQKLQAIQELGVREYMANQTLSLSGRKILIAWNHTLSQHQIGDSSQNQIIHRFPAHTKILTLLKDPAGEIWLGTNKGIFHLPSKNFYLQSVKSDSLRVHHIYADPHGFFWLATQKGLVKWRPFTDKPAHVLDHELFFKNNQLHAVYPDTSGRLWMSSNNGILAVDTLDYSVARYSEADGLVHPEFNYASHLQDAQQNLYFGGIGGLSVFNPHEIGFKRKRDHQFTPAILSGLKAVTDKQSLTQLEREWSEDKQSTWRLIPDNLRSLQLNFDFTDYSGQPVHHAWRIPQVNSNWNTFSIKEGLRFYQLPYGYFDLEIRTTSLALSNLEKQSSYRFYQAYPWYRQAWGFALLALITLSLSYALSLWQRNKNKNQKLKLERAIQQQTSDLRKQNRIIQEQNLSLQKVDEAKNKLFKNINHEFRTPLSIIQVESQILREELMEHTATIRHFQNIEEQTQHLNKMLDEVMELGKLETGTLISHKEQVAWPMSMLKLISQFEGLAHKKHLNYQIDLSPKQRKFLSFDYPRFERIATNLINNALKFTPELGRVTVRVSVESGQLSFAVEDNGPGISPADQKRIFQRYQQGAAAQESNRTGFGIGLALAKEYAHLLEGSLSLESQLGEGSCFTLTIPVNEEEVPAFLMDNRYEAPLEPSSVLTNKAHVLVVEDHPQLQKSLIDILKKHYRVSSATHGLTAFKMLQGDPSIQLILSDAMMPLMDGFQLLQKVRQDPKLKAKPFILLTALSDNEERLNGLRLGVDAYLTKPFDNKELLVRMKNLLNQQQERSKFISTLQAEIPHPKDQQKTEANYQDPALESFDEAWLKELEKAVHSLLADPKLKVAYIADQLHISERTLFNKVKAYTGLSPSEYLRKSRLNQAKALLQARHYPTVKEVAYAVGFLDTKNFAVLYKKEFVRNPKEDLEA